MWHKLYPRFVLISLLAIHSADIGRADSLAMMFVSDVFFDTTRHVNPVDASTSVVGSTALHPFGFGLVGLAFDGSSTLYGIATRLSGGSGSSQLVTISGTTGRAFLVGDTGFAGVQSIAVHPLTGALYGVSLQGTVSVLISIDPITGAGLHVSEIPFSNVQGLAFDLNGVLYGTDVATNNQAVTTLFTIDPSTGNTAIEALYAGIFIHTFDFDSSGMLIAVDRRSEPTDTLLRIDLSTGSVHPIGYLPAGSHQGMAFTRGTPVARGSPLPVAAVPEPSQYLVLHLGLMVIVLTVTRRKQHSHRPV